jgi:hypothetical protein
MDSFAIPKIELKPGGRDLNVLATYAVHFHHEGLGVFLCHRFLHGSRHGAFPLKQIVFPTRARASRTIVIKPEVSGVKQLDNGIDETFVSGVREEVSLAFDRF